MTNHFYDAHIFCCINERAPDHPRGSCARRGSVELHQYMKEKSKELGIEGIRVNKAGCLDRCELGPVMVIYPEGTWYAINSTADIDEILEHHVINGTVVEHLALANDQEFPNPPAGTDLQLNVSKVENLTDRIKLFELRSVNGSPLPPFTAGAHIDLKINEDLRRSYSLTNSPSERDRYVISVLDEPDGRGGSHWIHGNLHEGAGITVVVPENNFELVDNADEHIFIAGGIGISPILSMGRHLHNQGTRKTLHYCTQSPDQTAFRDEVAEIFADSLTLHHDGGDPANGINLEDTLQPRPDGAHLYICGPKGLIDAALNAASHWPEGTVHYELFSGSEAADQDGDETFTVILKKSGKTLDIRPGESILEVIRDAGVEAESACQSGICGTCQTGLLSGKADHRDEFLTAEDQDTQIMICVSRAKPGETLILDI